MLLKFNTINAIGYEVLKSCQSGDKFNLKRTKLYIFYDYAICYRTNKVFFFGDATQT